MIDSTSPAASRLPLAKKGRHVCVFAGHGRGELENGETVRTDTLGTALAWESEGSAMGPDQAAKGGTSRLRPGIDVALTVEPIRVFGFGGCGTRTLAGVLFDRLSQGRLLYLKVPRVHADTSKRLLKIYSDLQHGVWPDGADGTSPICFGLEHDDNVIHTAAEVVIRRYPKSEELKPEQADQWVQRSSGLVFLVDPQWIADACDQPDEVPEAWQRLEATLGAVREAAARLPSSKQAPRVLAVVTKSDLWETDLAGRRGRLLRYLKRTMKPLRKAVRHFRIMTVSATGESNLPPDEQGRPVPPLPLNPTDLAEPFYWHARTYLREKLLAWKVAGLALAVLLIVAGIGLWAYDDSEFAKLEHFWNTHQTVQDEPRVLKRCGDYLRWHWLGRHRGRVKEIRAEVTSLQQDRDWKLIAIWVAENPSDYAGHRERLQEHQQRFPLSKYSELCGTEIEKAFIAEEAHDYGLVLGAVRGAESLERVRILVQAYLTKWPENDPHAKHRGDVVRHLEDTEGRSYSGMARAVRKLAVQLGVRNPDDPPGLVLERIIEAIRYRGPLYDPDALRQLLELTDLKVLKPDVLKQYDAFIRKFAAPSTTQPETD